MAQEIWLLRHGDAEGAKGGDDAARPLTARGQRQSRAAGAALKALGVEFAAVLTSPRVRARDTARLAVEALGAAVEVEEHEPLSGGFDRDAVLHVMAGRGADDRVLLVGHEPDFSQIVHDLSGARCQVKKGGIAALSVARGEGELLTLLRPAELAKMG